MSEVKRLVKNTMIIAIGSISTKLITFAMLPFYTAYLTTAEYGIYDYIFQIAMFVLPAITLLMDESVFRFLIDCKDDYDKKVVISNALILEIIGTVIFVILAYGLGTYFEINYLIYSIAYIVACVLATIVNPIMRGQGKYTLFTLFNSLISLFLTILSIVFLMIFNMGVEGLLLANTLAHFIMFVLFSVLLKIWLYIDLKSINLKKINEMIRYSSPLVLNRLAWIFINIANRIIIMEFLGAIIAGTFAVAYKFPLLVSTVYGFFGVSWQETAARALHDGDVGKFYNMIYKKINMLLNAIMLGAIAFLPILFYLLVDDKFYGAIDYIPVMIVATYFNCLATFLGGILTAYKDTKAIGKPIVYSLIMNVLIGLLFIDFWGIYSILLALLVSNIYLFFARLKYSNKYIKIESDKTALVHGALLLVVVYFLFAQNKFCFNVLNIVITCLYGVYVLYITEILINIKNRIYRYFV